MNNYLIGALALAATSAPGIASENEWLSMDSELESLRSFSTQSDGPNLSGWIITSLRIADNVGGGSDFGPPGPATTNDLGGFNLDSVRLNVDGSVSDYSYKISAELGESDGLGGPQGGGTPPLGPGGQHAPNRGATLLDAYVDWTVGESVNVRMGNFRTPFLRSALIDRNRTLFTDRSVLGGIFAGRQAGLQISGDFEKVRWALAATNGFDGIGDELLITGRVEVDVLGDGAGGVEGAYGANNETNLTIGVAGSDEGSHQDGQSFAIDAQFTAGPFSASAEFVDFDKGTGAAGAELFGFGWAGLNGAPIAIGTADVSDTTPKAFTASYLFGEDQYEVAARFEDSDNLTEDVAVTVGLNRYIHGHDIKWSFSYTDYNTNNGVTAFVGDVEVITVSLAMGF